MTSEKFCLKWNDFESNVSSSFKDLLAERELFDVTLASGDGQIQAHKVILAACSPFFRAVFRRNPHQHPLLYLKDVRQADLASVIQFIYHVSSIINNQDSSGCPNTNVYRRPRIVL